jgi:Tol biopolymer transport system component
MKRTNLILVILGVVSLLFASALAQQLQPPKPGTYYCYTSQYNPAQAIVYSISYTPAFFGNIILDGKGNYTLTMRKNTGKYMFDKTTGIMTFTGDLKIMRYQNVPSQKDTFLLIYQDLTFACGLTTDATKPGEPATGQAGKDSKPQGSSGNTAAPAKTLNQGLTGKILATISDENNLFLGSVFEFDLAKGTFSTLFGSGAAQRNAKGEIIYFDKTSRLKLTDKTGNKTLLQFSDQIRYNFPDFYPALSHDGAFVAINRGDTLEVIDRNGQKIAEFPGLRQASWTPDGRIVAVGDGTSKRGLFMIDNQFREAQQIVEGYEEAQTPAVSPDGKRIAFYNLEKVLTVTLDGQNPVEAIIGGRMSFPTWSPDGKYLAVNIFYTANVDQNHIFIANLATDKGFFLEDSAGNRVNSRNRISWTP